MRRAALATVIACLVASGSARAAPPIEAYGRLPGIELTTISPSGQQLATVAVVGEERRILITTTSGKALLNLPVGHWRIWGLDWADEDHLLLTYSRAIRPIFVFRFLANMGGVLNIQVSKRHAQELIGNNANSLSDIFGFYGEGQVDGRPKAFLSRYPVQGGSAYPNLYEVDLETARARMLADGGSRERHWVVGHDGSIVAHSEYDHSSGQWRLYKGHYTERLLADRISPLDDVSLAGAGRTAGTVLVVDRADAAEVVTEISVSDGARTELLPGRVATAYFRDPDTGLLLGATTQEPPYAQFFDEGRQKRYEATRKAFPGLVMRVESITSSMDRMIVRTSGGDDSGTYWLVDIPSGKAEPLGYPYPAIRAKDVAPVRWFKYAASDGLAMEGVLTLPLARVPKNLPVVVLPHGGPIGVNDNLEFDWWAQAYASAGYAVFQPNYRGSSGYGETFRKAGFGQWGRKMLTDVSEGLAALVTEGIVDPKRACIVGGSYGGYAALAGITLQRGLYRCAVSVAGVADMPLFFSDHRRAGAFTRYWRAMLGTDKEGDGMLPEISPAHHAADVETPVLLIHGKDDTVVPIEQSEVMAAALKKAGKPVEFVTMAGEDHWLSREVTRTEMLKRSLAFLKEHNPPD